MIKPIITCYLLLQSLFSTAQSFDCYKFREGRFRTADPNAGGIILTERRGGYQTETYEALKLIIRFRINWTSNCAFNLVLDKVTRNDNKINIPANANVQVKIIATDKQSYTQQVSSSVTNGNTISQVTKLD